MPLLVFGAMLVSTHSRPKAAAFAWRKVQGSDPRFQHTAARRRLLTVVSPSTATMGFNTQPPEGGCFCNVQYPVSKTLFQHTAARRRLLFFSIKTKGAHLVSTHSRPKAAASPFTGFHPYMVVSTHSRPKAAAITNASKKY